MHLDILRKSVDRQINKLELSQQDAAKKIGISGSALSGFLTTTDRMPKFPNIVKLAEFACIPVNRIFGESDEVKVIHNEDNPSVIEVFCLHDKSLSKENALKLSAIMRSAYEMAVSIQK